MNFHVGWEFSSEATIFTGPHHDVAAAVIEAGLFPQSVLPYVSPLRTETDSRKVRVVCFRYGQQVKKVGDVM